MELFLFQEAVLKYNEVDTLFLSFSWIRQFFLDNGIVRIPEYLALSLETCGILYYLLIFIFVVSLLVGYGRQMSSFYFFYQHIMGQKLDNPYKPSMIITSLWVAVQIIATGLAMGGVYFIKYGYLVAIMVAATTILALLILYVVTTFIMKKMTVKNVPQTASPVTAAPPVHEKIIYQSSEPAVRYIQGPSVGQPQPQNADPQFMEALMILGLKPDFTKDDLQAQYKKLIKKVHADKGGSDGLYLKVKQCYEYLLSRTP